MPNIIDILARAQSLMNETALNSITPPRAGGIMYDTLLVLNQMQLEGASLLISKVYASVSAMEADTTPTSDLTGRALKPGQLVVIVTSSASSSDMGSEYRYNGPGSWTYVGKVGGLPLDTVPTQSSTNGITSGGVYATLAAMKAEGYKYMGIATPGSGGTAPGTPNQPVFYIGGPGSYPNYGSITVASGYLGFIKYSGGSWSVESVEVGKDYDEQISQLEVEVFGNTIICDLASLPVVEGIITSGQFWSDGGTSVLLPVNPGEKYRIIASQNSGSNYCFLASNTLVNHKTPTYATGYSDRVILTSGQVVEVTAPNDAVSMWIRKTLANGTDCLPVVYLLPAVPKPGLVKRVGVLEENEGSKEDLILERESLSLLQRNPGLINSGNAWNISNSVGDSEYVLLPIVPGKMYKVVSGSLGETQIAILADDSPGTQGSTPVWATGYNGRIVIQSGGEKYIFTAPKDAEVLYIRLMATDGTDMTPEVYSSIVDAGLMIFDNERLLKATFNSSINETDVDAVREKFCGKLGGNENVETFMFFSDPHLTPNSRYEEMNEYVRDWYISALQKHYNSLPLDFCICGGDWLNFDHTNPEAVSWLGYSDAYMRKMFRNYRPVFGNHDNNPYNPTTDASNWLKALTYGEVRNAMFRENDGTYYSFDGLHTKFYVLNSGVSFIKGMTDATYSRLVDNRWPQIAWLANKLLTDDAPHGAIVLHIYSNATGESNWYSNETGYWAHGIHALAMNAKNMCVAYNNRTSITLNGITYDFSSCEGKIEFFLCGHTHFDFVDTTNEIPIICTTNLEGGHIVGGSIVYDLKPTFDNCIADYDDGKMSMVRVGAGVGRIVHLSPSLITIGTPVSLETELTGTVTWESRNTSIATVSIGSVSGVSSGITGIIATDENGDQEYWIVKVS